MFNIKRQSLLFKFLQACVFLVPLLFFLSYISNSVFSLYGNKTLLERVPRSENANNLKYILQWTSAKTEPFDLMGVGQSAFIKRKCKYTNCFVTQNRNFLGKYTNFDAIAFAWPQLSVIPIKKLPRMRSPKQKYIFASIESPIYYPACKTFFNGYFNWTWTYKLDSDSRWRYVDVWQIDGIAIGPKQNMHWIKVQDMDPVSDEIKEIISKKHKAAAWFVSNCHSKSKREDLVDDLRKELRNYNLYVDIYGGCDKLRCPKADAGYCYNLLERDYYFYLSFENSFAEDYVTEKLLTALQHNTVPIVYGGANYSRFMPDGIYLDAQILGVKKLANMMNHLIQNPEEYLQYFRWKNHYSYDRKFIESSTDNICSICDMLNDKNKVESVSIHNNLVEWWNPPGKCDKIK